jgi:broad specificity phosphatase PhoE
MPVFLARHGRTAYNALGRFQGHLPVPLDDLGREQAAALAERAARREWAALYTSPLARARETARAVAARIGLEPREDPRLAETDCGDWTDRWFRDVQAEDPEGFAAFVRSDPGFRFPGGESFAEQAVRVDAALREIARGPLPALVVCHRGVMRLALGEGVAEIGNAALLQWPPPAPPASVDD